MISLALTALLADSGVSAMVGAAGRRDRVAGLVDPLRRERGTRR